MIHPSRFHSLALASAIGLFACGTRSRTGPAAPAPATVAPATPAVVAPPAVASPPVQRLHLRASVTGLDDMLAAADEIAMRTAAGAPINARAQAQALLLGLGFGPGFFDAIDLAGTHAMAAAYPLGDGPAKPTDANLAGSIAVHDARRLIEGLPASIRPQPLGQGLWETAADPKLLLQELDRRVAVGLTRGDLAQAAGLPAQVGLGPRIRVRASDLPIDDLDPVALLGLPLKGKAARDLGQILRETEAVELGIDFGRAREFQLTVDVDAPLRKLGPVGPARERATALEALLPADPVVLLALSWGDVVGVLSTQLDAAVPKGLPEPFSGMAKSAVGGLKRVIGAVRDDVVLGLWNTPKGESSLLLAAKIADDAVVSTALRGLWQLVAQLVETQRALTAKTPKAQLALEYKPDGLGFQGGKADLLSFTVPADLRKDLAGFSGLIRGDRFEVVAVARGGMAVVAIGAGARKLVAEVFRAQQGRAKASLAADPGLARARELAGGCQVCLTIDTADALALVAQITLPTLHDRAQARALARTRGELAKIRADVRVGIGTRIEPEHGRLALAVPPTLVFADAPTWATLRKALDQLGERTVPAPPPPSPKVEAER